MTNKLNRDSIIQVDEVSFQRRKNEQLSELKDLEKECNILHQEQIYRKSMFDSATVGVCVCHSISEYPYVKFTVWNSLMNKITGYTKEEVNSLSLNQILYLYPEVQIRAKNRMAKIREGKGLEYERWEIIRADGIKRMLGISTSILVTNTSQMHVLALVQDVTGADDKSALKRMDQAYVKIMIKFEKVIQKNVELVGRLSCMKKVLLKYVNLLEAELEAKNMALRVLLDQREKDRREFIASIMANLNELIIPYLNHLGQTKLNTKQTALIEIIQANLAKIAVPFADRLTTIESNLTTMELKVADLIRNGYSNKEIAMILGISKNTVLTHRYHIRGKLDLKNKKINLRSYLKSPKQ